MEIEKVFLNGVDYARIGFFVWLYKTYGACVKDTHKEIAKKTSGMSYGSVRLHLLSLESAGYIQIENKGKWRQSYHLNNDIIKKIFDEQ